MKQMTFQEYDELMESFHKIQPCGFWPEEDDIKKFYENPDEWLMFALFLCETNAAPKDEEERKSRKEIMKFINEHMEIIYDDEE